MERKWMLLAAALFPMTAVTKAATFGEEVEFLAKHTPIVLLARGDSRVVLAPAWQGRVMTSAADGNASASFGWVNHELISSGKLQPHINVFGGEDRFWLGPEGGQFSIFFARGAKFELSDWYTPAPLDTMPYRLVRRSKSAASFTAGFTLTNYSGTVFNVKVDRGVRLLGASQAARELGFRLARGVRAVAFESENKITNAGQEPWSKETGLLSVWILGMFNPSPETTIVVPIKAGSDAELGVPVTSDYFGSIPADRLAVRDDVVYFSADGRYRSKLGISPKRTKGLLGSYDAANHALTIVRFTVPSKAADYVNSLWKIQEHPYAGDAANSYNDGPPAPGAKPLGPFYELESSSPGAALAPGKSLSTGIARFT